MKQAKIAVVGMVGRSLFMDVDRFHEGGETLVAKSFHEEWGGKGFNQAVAAARQNAQVSFLGACSNLDCKAIESAFADENGLSLVLAGKSRHSTFASILTDATGLTRVTCCYGAELEAADVAFFSRQIAESDILLLNNEVPEEVNLVASEIAEAHGVKVIFNPAPARQLPDVLKRRVSLFTPNEFELAGIGEVACEVVMTLGGKGCRILSSGVEVPPVFHGDPVDTTGAGDTFNGVLAVRLAEGEDIESACAAANDAAGQSVSKRFVMPSIPVRR